MSVFKKSSNKKSSYKKSSNDRDEKDSSDISDIEDNVTISDAFNYDNKKENNSSIDKEAEAEYIQTVVLDRVVKYIKIDDIIKKKQQEHRKEMKTIKDHKDKL